MKISKPLKKKVEKHNLLWANDFYGSYFRFRFHVKLSAYAAHARSHLPLSNVKPGTLLTYGAVVNSDPSFSARLNCRQLSFCYNEHKELRGPSLITKGVLRFSASSSWWKNPAKWELTRLWWRIWSRTLYVPPVHVAPSPPSPKPIP